MKLLISCLLNILCFTNFAQETSVFNGLPKSELYGFGESAHSNVQEYDSKFELAKFLSSDGTNVDLYIEIPHADQLYIDSFMNNLISEQDLLRNISYYFNKSQFFIEFLNKLKTLPNVNIYGIDMQIWKITYQFLLIKTKEHPILSELVHSLEPYLLSTKGKLEASELNELKRILNKIIEFVQKDLKKSDVLNIVYPSKNLYQCILDKHYFALKDTVWGYFRDSCMYDNVKFLKELNGNVGVVIAANFHTFKFPKYAKNMGTYLFKYFKNEYFIICSQFYEGNLQLPKKNEQGGYTRDFQHIPPLKKSISYYIYHYLNPKESQLFVLKDYDKSNSKFHKKYYLQDFGAGNANNFNLNYKKAVPSQFCDAILFNLKAYTTKYG